MLTIRPFLYLCLFCSYSLWASSLYAKLVLLDIELDYKNETLKLREEINVVTAFQNNEVKKIYGKKEKIYLIISPKIIPENNHIEINGELILLEDAKISPEELKKKPELATTLPPVPRTMSKFQFNGLTGSKSEVRSKNEAEFFLLEIRSHLMDAYGIPMKQDVAPFSNKIESIYRPEPEQEQTAPTPNPTPTPGSSNSTNLNSAEVP